jgi:ATP-dependent DNA ligase
MPYENQDHTHKIASSPIRVPNACGIVRHSTLWLRPEKVAQIEFLEWTGADHLRHTKFVRLRDDKDPRKVVRETGEWQ